MNPVDMLVNFLNNVVTAISPIAWPLFAMLVVGIIIRTVVKVQQEQKFPWSSLAMLAGSSILCYFIANPASLADWIKGLTGAV